MMCHSIEAARFLITDPEKRKDLVVVHTVAAEIASLKWTRPEYIQHLKEMANGKIDYSEAPAEDSAGASVAFEDEQGRVIMVEAATS